MNTNLKLAALGLALSAIAAPAIAYSQTTGGLAPGSVDVSGVAGLGVAFCQNANPAAPLGCGGAGLGVFFDVSTAAWGLNGLTQYATGSCSVSNSGALVQGDFSVTCGTDRDDDTFVTNVDNSPNDAGGVSTDSDNFDDDYATFTNAAGTGSGSAPVCFRSDVAFTAASQGVLEDSTGAVNGDSSWDDVVFFVGQSNTSVPTTLGAVAATLTLSAAAGCGAGVNVSAHTHG